MNLKELIARMTLKEKTGLCSGSDYWNTKPVPRLGTPYFTMSDGPHGLRKQIDGSDNLGMLASEEATCFPPACLTACSFDPGLVREMGEAIGNEAASRDVQMVLGPGVNIKRDPLCGRNFEYFSEDPCLSGEMGKAWIEGIQKTGVGACLKHFACNNQEDLRMSSDSLVDERALYEIYLPAFKKSLEAHPAAVMCSYNKLNGIYMSDNRKMVNGILREKWGYRGLTITDWGGMNDRVQAFRAGVDLEMPGNGGFFDAEVRRAVKNGQLSEESIDECVERILDTVFTLNQNKKNFSYDIKEHHDLAKKIAAESAVLLRNEGSILPLAKNARIAVIGRLAAHLRFQGSGSSHINAHMTSSLLDGLDDNNKEYTYYKGYHLNNSTNEALLEEAAEGCRACDVVVVAAGLTEGYEAEGFDRRNMKIPEAQNRLIDRINDVNPNVVVVLFGGAPMELPWIGKVKGVLHMYLPGQAGGLAAAELLLGIQNPGGKLAESYPNYYEDTPAAKFYGKTGKQAQYRESVFVGYRYYDKLDKEVLFPFGFGLSYTKFEYTGLKLSNTQIVSGEGIDCSFFLRNTGGVAGAEVVQVYVSKPVPGPVRELAGFAKVFLEPGEEKEVCIHLDPEVFLTYDAGINDFVLPGGEYKICAGSSSRDIRLLESVTAEGRVSESGLDEYIQGELTQEVFESLLKRNIQPGAHCGRGCFTRENSLAEMKDVWITRLIVWYARRTLRRANKEHEEHPLFNMMMDVLVNMPVGRFPLMSRDKMPGWAIRLLLNIENKRFWFAGEKI